MRYGELRKRILTRIRPTKQEIQALTTATDVLVAELDAALEEEGVRARVFVGGSAAKGTALRNNHDVDVFVRFPEGGDASDALERVLERLPDEYERVHGSRDYFHILRGDVTFEIVPVLDITDVRHAQNVTDVSPLHVTYAKKRLTARMRDDVRLAKQFCKAAKVYGAESYIQGFSGHVLELLIMQYGSFQQLMKAVASWGGQVVIDPERHHVNPLDKLNEAKLASPLVIIDPVQPDRNAAAALSQESYSAFINAAKRFVKKPSLAAFTIKKLSKEAIKKKCGSGALAIIEFTGFAGKRDVVGAKCLKAFTYVRKHLVGFTITKTGFEYDHDRNAALAYVQVAERRLPAMYWQEGPPVKAKGVASFKRKHAGKRVVSRDGRLFVESSRDHRTLRAAVAALLKDSYVTSRVRGARIV